ncbi:hypothetical protein Y032_0192g1360 [Ancylostoma ceylanicum]|uniref:Uncharacterized protein n=1 Tax=Ancylostoma ceylanicum TaxID=53326 RepID=A0A016SQG0_9BILA|nr:hypothetical protein Y032_0192g1360 [Ancylostoma ceylanicum]
MRSFGHRRPSSNIITEGTPAFERLRSVVLNKVLQRDLPKASPREGTSVCEAKNALDRLYCRKEIFYHLFTYKLNAMLSTMHFNTLRLAELAGERSVERVVEVQRKYFTRTSRVVLKTPVEHLWRQEIMQAVLDARKEHLEASPAEDVDVQEMVDAETAFYEGIPELNLESEVDSEEEDYEELYIFGLFKNKYVYTFIHICTYQKASPYQQESSASAGALSSPEL